MKPSIRVVLVRPRNPLNIGACARAMANFGLSDLVVVDPYEPIWQETRSAPEAEEVVLKAKAVKTWEEAVRGSVLVLGTSSFHQRPVESAAIDLPALPAYLAAQKKGLVTLVFGSERSGLSNEELVRCHGVLRIPTDSKTPSMNLAQAVAVVLYEMTRASETPAAAITPAADLKPLLESIEDLAEAIDYPVGYKTTDRKARIRQALAGVQLPAETLRFLLSLFRKLNGRQARAQKQGGRAG